MRLTPAAGELLMRERVQWLRCGFDDAALSEDIVTLAPQTQAALSSADPAPYLDGYAGLAFDRHCRLYHVQREARTLEVLLWGKRTALNVHGDKPQAYRLQSSASTAGDFAGAGALPQAPQALVCDDSDYLYLSDDQPQSVDGRSFYALWRIDSWQHEVVQRCELPAKVLDLCYADGLVYALLDADASGAQSVWTFSACAAPQRLHWPALAEAQRLEVALRENAAPLLLALCRAGRADAYLIAQADALLKLPLPYAGDLLLDGFDARYGWRLISARRPGEDFLCWRLQQRQLSPLPALQAPNYDGRGIARSPDGRVAYWSARGLRHAAPARARYLESGRVYGFALDCGHEQNEWGRLRIEACMPAGTRIRFYALSRDDLDYHDALSRKPPAGETLSAIELEAQTPLVSRLDWQLAGAAQELFAAATPQPLRLQPAAGFAWYDAPIMAPPGRYLWLMFELQGSLSQTPRLRSARIEYPRHQLLRQLPRTLWREPQAADFLARYLMPSAAMLQDWGEVSAQRHRLLDPRIAPPEALDWLGSLLGLVMDPCWPERAKRRMLREASALFAIRGTPAALQRMVEIFSGGEVLIIEKFRLRQGGVYGNAQARSAGAVLGAGFRVGGSLASEAPAGIDAQASAGDFAEFAHRFSITVVADLSDEQLRALRKLIETHKPAHTMFDLCTAATGARVGLGLHSDLAAVIGHSSGFSPLILDEAVLGRGYRLGRPAPQSAPDAAAPGQWQRQGDAT
ncbi:phage tail protein domain-containing protein [Solimonas aquatica]|uniref:Phage tail protein domain-containing protein n=1 Tax=Solimonas aquatica TaxID=489703 RepID=A0A1H8ZJE7_9GAMM|nr:phage tail protein [Solimonas aquatica]SEP63828.1 phage tail protein domain-containing protein [Solimonas aquatica]